MDANNIGSGITGAKRASWEHNNPRDLVARLAQRYPRASEWELAEHLKECVLGDDSDYLLPILRMTVRNIMRALEDEKSKPRKPRKSLAQLAAANKARAERIERAKTKWTDRIHEEAEKLLLDHEAPYGKPLRDCSGKECTRFGGWYQRLGAKVGPRKLVGDVLTEEQVRELL
jgi:hypothetical protein